LTYSPPTWEKYVSREPADSDDIIQALVCGLDVFCAFGPGRERLTIAQVAKACNLTRARARRILLTLESLGYVELKNRDFALTSKVLNLSNGFLRRSIWEKAEAVLTDVVRELNETASIGVLQNFDVVYTRRVRSSRALHLDLHQGEHVPAHASSVGRVLLAGLEPQKLREYLQQAELVRFTPNTVADVETLTKRIREVRETGWCYVSGEIDEGVTGVSVPLNNSRGAIIAGLSIGTTSKGITKKSARSTILPTLRDAARRISVMLKSSLIAEDVPARDPLMDWHLNLLHSRRESRP
jgi:IclR family pca regulon transcriptional regulator